MNKSIKKYFETLMCNAFNWLVPITEIYKSLEEKLLGLFMKILLKSQFEYLINYFFVC
jgi:hypothetical protein